MLFFGKITQNHTQKFRFFFSKNSENFQKLYFGQKCVVMDNLGCLDVAVGIFNRFLVPFNIFFIFMYVMININRIPGLGMKSNNSHTNRIPGRKK